MEKKQNHRQLETHVLNQIVDAMLESEIALEPASVEEWTRILVDACRRQKHGHAARQFSMASTC